MKTLLSEQAHLPWPLHERTSPAGDRMLVTALGAQALAWRTADGIDRLYLSAQAGRDPAAPIRGGIPVCWPQFDRLGPLPQHGWVRTALWTSVPTATKGGLATAAFELRASALPRIGAWAATDFLLRVEHSLGLHSLTTTFKVSNTGTQTFAFTAALHNYFRLNSAQHHTIRFEAIAPEVCPDTLNFNRDQRLWQTVRASVAVLGSDAGLDIVSVHQTGFDTWMIWNPGLQGAHRLHDLPEGDSREFVCIEATQTRLPVVLEPGGVWLGRQTATAISGGAKRG